ncbi:Glycosyl transferase family 2 [Bifidobacterium thermophilum]|uniref:Glycosyl transferase family 2 n=1 Tax=Bifidobacterium thermophilum TaxID=33905 RepID=A0A2N3QPK6_9BIFI|nr:glycosyltransferase [Bifidobacterium thermophilum]PKU93552.1 Glycosyl transferase family 2 [Bifidobacterium thermophilum]
MNEEMSQPKVSIIIPVYNGSRYLEECLRSIIGQDYSNLEIIIVDDGSTDDSASIAKNIASCDQRIIVLTQVNAGPGAARNLGLSCASGEYILFVDSDDLLIRNAVSNSVRLAETKHADLVCFDFESFDDSHVMGRTLSKEFPKYLTSTSRECLMEMYTDHLGYFSWSFLYKANIFTDDGMKFPENILMLEDMLMLNTIFRLQLKVAYIPRALYRYRITSDSLSHRNSIKKAEDALIVIEHVIDMSYADKTIHIFAPSAIRFLVYIDEITPIGVSIKKLMLHRRIKQLLRKMLGIANTNEFDLKTKIKIFLTLANLQQIISLYHRL